MDQELQHLQTLLYSAQPENIELAFSIMESTGRWLPLPTEAELETIHVWLEDVLEDHPLDAHGLCKAAFLKLFHRDYFHLDFEAHTSFSSALRWYRGLETLHLNQCENEPFDLALLPDWFNRTTFPNLKKIRLSGNFELSKAFVDRLIELELQELEWSENTLSTVFPPQGCAPMPALRHLCVEGSPVVELRLDELPELQILFVKSYRQQARSIQLIAHKPTKIRQLFLTNFPVEPSFMSMHPDLRVLDLVTSPLISEQWELANWAGLEKVQWIGYPKSKTEKLAQAIHLKMLCLGNINMRKVPDFIRNMKELTYLELTNQSIRTIPDWLGELTELREVGFTDLPLESIPMSLTKLPNLQQVVINKNTQQVPAIQAVLQQMPPTVNIADEDELPF